MTRLALSGGGFRATLFHLGVIRRLYEQQALHEVTEIASVSGGSILAAHVVLHWDDYCDYDRPDLFEKRADEVIRFIRTGIRNQIFMTWLMWLLVPGFVLPLCIVMLAGGGIFATSWAYWAWYAAPASMLIAVGIYTRGLFARITALTSRYRRLYGASTLANLGATTAAGRTRPTLYLTATSLTTGELCCFQSVGFCRGDATAGNTFGCGSFLIARAVAASSAFPPAFDPVLLTPADLGHPRGFPRTIRLTDGGVYDNMGLAALAAFSSSPLGDRPESLILSDAEQPFGEEVEEQYKLLAVRVARTTDIMMNRISTYQVAAVPAVLPVRLQDVLPHPPGVTDAATQGHVRRVRTDLDGFSKAEIQMLVHQGYAAARYAFREPVEPFDLRNGVPTADNREGRWLPFRAAELGSTSAAELRASAKRRVWMPIFTSWQVIGCALILFTVLWYVRWGKWVLPHKLKLSQVATAPLWPPEKRSHPLLMEMVKSKGGIAFVRSQRMGEAVSSLLWVLPTSATPCVCRLPAWERNDTPILLLARRLGGGAELEYRVLGFHKNSHGQYVSPLTFRLDAVQPDDYLIAVVKGEEGDVLRVADELELEVGHE